VPGGGLRLTIGVMGAATGVLSRDVLDRAHALGRAIATSGCVLVTGACPGLPQASACGAKQAGGMVVGISPGLSLDEHVHKYGSPTEHGRVDEGGFGMRVTRRVAARAVFDEHALDALAGNVRQLVLVDEGHLGVLLLRRIGEGAAKWQGGDKAANRGFVSWSSLPRLAGARSDACL
jgi:hypothetical protein